MQDIDVSRLSPAISVPPLAGYPRPSKRLHVSHLCPKPQGRERGDPIAYRMDLADNGEDRNPAGVAMLTTLHGGGKRLE